MLDDYDFQKPRVDLTVFDKRASPTGPQAVVAGTVIRDRFFFDARSVANNSRAIQSEAILCSWQSTHVRSKRRGPVPYRKNRIHRHRSIGRSDEPRLPVVTSSRLDFQTSELVGVPDAPFARPNGTRIGPLHRCPGSVIDCNRTDSQRPFMTRIANRASRWVRRSRDLDRFFGV